MKYSNKERNQLSWARTMPFYCEWHVTDRAAVYNEELYRDACINFADNFFCKDYEDEKQRDHLTKLYECILKEMETNLPEQIKRKVADIRVLALGYLTEEIHEELMNYSNEAELKLEQIEKENYAIYQEALSHLSLEARSALERSFHDSRLLEYGYLDKDIYLLLKMDVGLAPLRDQYLKLILKDAVVLEGTISKELVCWIQEELYFDGDIKLNIHFSGGDVLIQAKDMESEFCYSFFASDTKLPLLQQADIVAGKVKNLIQEGKLTLEEAKKHPLCECMGVEAFMNMSILVSGNMDDLAKLTVGVCDDSEKGHTHTDKKYIYDINLVNTPEINEEDGTTSWLRGQELLQYINDYSGQEIELWVVWTDCDQPVKEVEYSLTELTEADLRLLYEDNEHGILRSHRIVIRK
ncbi:MAG: hypothetical protein H6Q59_290 [Firmicutes bacterium]|nr:hypothetical protein [Bacillota bacterium]